ncbi:16S rRNA (guanine(527)-N(7))-methyltransferase RsmG [Rhodovulum sp. FJ3]|uniref:16S rRNA (guanine(527)-N(7))-methyltransferase RsmG n=1 Tax=Rhodovulum sp. FJ3 TaxID=3079053 RepID=UPI00293DB9E1|nr:16S rRNA (guanine(527)-N(7))-methyltransferase RsmG [Rhodovulum sp. FJ3]MDV4169161.1 16S rRNA (guanine(527)-N(7))-methyltransferase RsmG [Rhodovulum sp. FJ3]
MGHEIAGLNVSRETLERLETYEQLLHKWNPAINLVSKNTLAEAWTRHIADSAQIFSMAPSAKIWADLGSGGGFPGMVVAILAAELSPDQETVLVESDQRKSVFLRTVARETGVKARVLSERIEQVPALNADVLSARALASLTDLLGFADLHLAQDGVALFPKGENFQMEIDHALETWRFDVQKLQSATDSGAVVLKIKGLSRV